MGAVTITGAASDFTFAERLAAVRAQHGDTLLVSHVDDRRVVSIGHYVWEAAPDGTTYVPRHGIVVERWANDDGEAGVTAVTFDRKGTYLGVVAVRLLVEALRDEVLPEPYSPSCWYASRMLHAAVGQGARPDGSARAVSEQEGRWLCWAAALAAACGIDIPEHPQGDPQ